MGTRGSRIVLFVLSISFALSVLIRAEEHRSVDLQEGWGSENVRAVEEKLRDAGLYFGEIDGAYSSELAAALGRYQIRNGLPITGQLDVETSNALGTKPAVTSTTPDDYARTSEVWQRLRKNDQQLPDGTEEPAKSSTAKEMTSEMPLPRSTPAATAAITSENKEPASAPPATADTEKPMSHVPAIAASSLVSDFSTEQLRDYVGAFVLAGLDAQIGAEAAFFADRVQYYDEGVKDREKIRNDLKRYDSAWPGRKFWLAGDITVEPQTAKRVRVTFPLRYELRNGGKRSSGKVKKTLVLERAGDELQIVAVNERKLKQ
ncbi:MAG TPA: peptidoglycan-binding domain-containing protein [Candidatus Udaeobacter sp.]